MLSCGGDNRGLPQIVQVRMLRKHLMCETAIPDLDIHHRLHSTGGDANKSNEVTAVSSSRAANSKKIQFFL